MDISTLSDDKVYEVAIPIWETMMQGSNAINFELFSNSFSSELKERIGKEKFERQCKEFPLLTSLAKAEPIACIRRHDGVTVIFRQLSTQLEGEYIGQVRLSGETNNIEVTDAQVY